jgi:RimJ/RimL family protein N-acetyltransferase
MTELFFAGIPVLKTERLVLRPFVFEDAVRVQALAGEAVVAKNTLNLPHPYPDGMAQQWIASHALEYFRAEGLTLAITLRSSELIGAIGLVIDKVNLRGELGYWIGVEQWNRGYCTEAAQAMVTYGFETLKLHRILACHFVENPASGRVMQKVGLTKEGTLIDHVVKDGCFRTVCLYAAIAPRLNAQP